MPPPPGMGLQPSILDRLIDPESAGTAIMSGYSIPQMYDAVMRDLEDLLNTRRPIVDLPKEYPELCSSVFAYGLPDLASVDPSSTKIKADIRSSIQAIVERFEPRLRKVKVTMLTNEKDVAKLSVRFRIDALLHVDPAPDVSFDTILEVGSNYYSVTEPR